MDKKGLQYLIIHQLRLLKPIFEGLKRSLCCVVHENVDQRNNKNQDQLMKNGMME